MSDEITRREKLKRDESADAAGFDVVLGDAPPPEAPASGESARPVRPPRNVDLSGIKLETGGMTQIDPPAGEPSILDSVEPATAKARMGEAFGRSTAGAAFEAMPGAQRALFLRVAGSGMALAGLLLILWAFTGGKIPREVTAALPIATFAVTPVPATPAPTIAHVATPLSAGPIVATASGTMTTYTVESAQGDGLKYQWAHSATCGSHLGETTATYQWDHPTPPCPAGSFQTSFITVQITDASGLALVRQYPTLGSRAGRGPVPDGGGVFTPQPGLATTVVRTSAPTTAAATQSASATYVSIAPTTKSEDGTVNFPLAGAGAVLVIGGGAVVLGPGRKRATDLPMLREDDRRY
jgi:hypothetical protein